VGKWRTGIGAITNAYDEPAASIFKAKEEVECDRNGVDVGSEPPKPCKLLPYVSNNLPDCTLHSDRCGILKSLVSRMTTDVVTCSPVAAWAVNKAAPAGLSWPSAATKLET
jgi:hypothetical protein